jgi:hypothetical protein
MFSTKDRLNEKLGLLAGRLLPGLALVVLFLILPTAASAQFTCPPQDQAGFPLGQSNLTTNPIFCSYPAVPNENPNDFFCTYSKTTGNLVQDNDAGFCPATAVGTAAAPPTISKAFADSEIQLFGPSNSTALTFTITNPNAATSLPSIAFTDVLPSGLVVSTPNGLNGSCGGGTITATAGTSTISLAGATLAGGASCTFSVNVSGVAIGVQVNITSNVTAVGGTVVGNAATATTSVDALFFLWQFSDGGGGHP